MKKFLIFVSLILIGFTSFSQTTFYRGDSTMVPDGSGGRVIQGGALNGIKWDSIPQHIFVGKTGYPTFTIDLTNPLQVNLSGTVKFNFNQSILTSGSFTAQNGGGGTNWFDGATHIGNDFGSADLTVQSSQGNAYTKFEIGPNKSTGYDFISLADSTGTAHGELIYLGSAANVGVGGSAFSNGSTFLGSVLGNSNYGSTSSTDTVGFYVGGSTISNRVIALIPNGDILIHQSSGTDSAALLQIGAGTSSKAQISFQNSIDPTILKTGQLWFVKGSSALLDSLNFYHNGTITNLLNSGGSSGVCSSGSYIPYFSSYVNFTLPSGSLYTGYYTINNGVVDIQGSGSIGNITTASTLTSITFDLPINTTTPTGNYIGEGVWWGGTSTTNVSGIVTIASSSTVIFSFYPTATGYGYFSFHCRYHN